MKYCNGARDSVFDPLDVRDFSVASAPFDTTCDESLVLFNMFPVLQISMQC